MHHTKKGYPIGMVYGPFQALLLQESESPMNAPPEFDNVDDIKIFLEYWSKAVIRSILDHQSQLFNYLYVDRLVTFSQAAKGAPLMGNHRKNSTVVCHLVVL